MALDEFQLPFLIKTQDKNKRKLLKYDTHFYKLIKSKQDNQQ